MSEDTKKHEYQKIPKIKFWLQEKGITQDELCQRTHLSVRTVHKMCNTGLITPSTIKLVAYELDLKEQELIELLTTEENKERMETISKKLAKNKVTLKKLEEKKAESKKSSPKKKATPKKASSKK
jgi:transcriptional regulator with XRE-family HTH domain